MGTRESNGNILRKIPIAPTPPKKPKRKNPSPLDFFIGLHMISISKTVCHHFQHRLIPPVYTRGTYCDLYQFVGGSFQVQNFFAISLFHWPEKSPKSLKTPIVEVCTPHISPTICPYRFQEHNALQSICDKVVSY